MSEDDEERVARAVLVRLSEAGETETFRRILDHGACEAARMAAHAADVRWSDVVALACRDLDAGAAVGARFVTPTDGEWPYAAFDALAAVVPAPRTGVGSSTADRGRVRDAGRAGPERLAPPVGLWVSGALRLTRVFPRSVAVVGSRAATGYGDHMAREIGFGLAEAGYVVVSGGAFGVDAAAHRGALAGPGATVAVLAGGVDVPYPRANSALLERVRESGCLVSERPPGSSVARDHFLVRNRTIATLGAGTVVVEAPVRSGALATARRAGLVGRPLMAVPGPVTSALSAGCHLLVREYGATLVCSADDVVEVVAPMGDQLPVWPQGPRALRDGLGASDRQVLDALPAHGATTAGDLARSLYRSEPHVTEALDRLVAHGLVGRTAAPGPGGGPEYQVTEVGRADGRIRV